MTSFNLDRFLQAQEGVYPRALREIQTGRKQTHWMWFIFPQLAGLGHSEMAKSYAIADLAEAEAYLSHPVLGARLIEISKALLSINGKTALDIMGSPDDLKLRSSMTLFGSVEGADGVFDAVLQRYYYGEQDPRTRDRLP